MLTSNIFVPNPLADEQKTTPSGFRRGVDSKILCIRYNHEIKPLLSVQHEFNFGSGIIRGHRNHDGKLMMDHILNLRGQQLFGADIRLGTISIWEHQIRYLLQHRNSNERIVGLIGNGNLTQNPYFVAWFGKDGLLIRLQQESINTQEYDCVVVNENNRVTVNKLKFKSNNSAQTDIGWQAINAATQQPLPDTTQVAFSGQRIVKNGQAMSRQELEAQIIYGQFYDLRHVFRFPAVSSGEYWKDLALEQFYDGKGIDTDVVTKALRGEAIATRWQDLTDDENSVRKALLDKGYQEATSGKPGTYSFSGDFVNIVFLDSIYCHNVLGVEKETGKLCSMQVTGWSNNVGATLQGLSQLAANVFQDAILLNNGGDVFFLVNQDQNERMIPYSKLDDPNWTLVPSCENRYYIRAVLLLIAQPLRNNDIEVVKPNFRL